MIQYEIDAIRYDWDGAAAARCRRRERPGKPRMEQAAVARALGVSRQMVCMWEKGRYTPKPERLPQLAALYRCAVTEFLRPVRAAA